MSLSQIAGRYALLAAWSFVFPAIAKEPPAPFEADLLHVTEPIHIQPDVHLPRFGRRPKPASVKASISPEAPYTLNNMRGKSYDVSATLRKIGMTLPKGSRALFCPETQTLYVESTHDDVEIAKAMFYSDPPPIEYAVDVQVTCQTAEHEERLLEVKSVPVLDGRELKFNTSNRESVRLTIESIRQHFSYGDDVLPLVVDVKVESGDNAITAKSTWQIHSSKPVEAMLGRLADATVTLRIQAHSRQGRWGDDPESEQENKAAAIKEIQKQFLSKP